ncbi:hypothetical protein HK102_011617 [Quaeritorhiza haematococci]|nr:hypothetical protein HK102_011617 [Quaeritorhiza haematococci]
MLYEACNVRPPPPHLHIPTRLLLIIAFINELLYTVLSPLFPTFPVFVQRAEIYKLCVTHTFSMEKAKKEIGYRPKLHAYEKNQKKVKEYYVEFIYEDD